MKFEGKPEQNKGPEKIPSIEIDLSPAWDSESEAELFIEGLKKSGIYEPNLKFSGFNADNIDKPLDVIFCSSEENLSSGSDGSEENALKYALDHDNAVVAVYDGSKLENVPNDNGYAYKITGPNAVKAYVHLKK